MISRRYIFPLLQLLFMLSNALPGWWDWGYAYGQRRWYYIMQAISLLFIGLSISYYDKKDKLHNKCLTIILWCMVANVLDELIFDPIHLGINEMLFGIFIVFWTFYKK